MGILRRFLLNLFVTRELTPEQQQEVIQKLFEKIRETKVEN